MYARNKSPITLKSRIIEYSLFGNFLTKNKEQAIMNPFIIDKIPPSNFYLTKICIKPKSIEQRQLTITK